MSHILLNPHVPIQQKQRTTSSSNPTARMSALAALNHRAASRSPNPDSSATNGQRSLHNSMLDSDTPLKPNYTPSSHNNNGGRPRTDLSITGILSGSAIEDDEDDEEEEDGEDDEDSDKPAADSPASTDSLSTVSTPVKKHLAGRNKRKLEDDGTVRADDEFDYPRKKATRSLSTTDKGMLAYALSGSPEEDAVSDDLDLALEDDDDEDSLLDGDDAEDMLEREEEAALIREFELDSASLGADPEDEDEEEEEGDTTIKGIEDLSVLDMDFDLSNVQLPDNPLEDLDSELFSTQWNDPHRFDDISQSYFDFPPFASDTDNDLFTADPTPAVTPQATPRGSISMTAEDRNKFPDVFSGTDEDEESSNEIDLTPFFEKGAAALKHLVNSEGKGGWSEETDEDDADLVKYFFSSEEYDSHETDESEDEDMSDEGGDTTDEEEDLPMPTPREKSNLRRASISSNVAVRPQIVSLDDNEDAGGPTLCSWVADPTKPICVIEGTKQTFLIPNVCAQLGLQDAGSDALSNNFISLEESESENSNRPFDPTLTGLTEVEGGMLNGSDFLGAPETFYGLGDEAMFSDIFNDESLIGDEDVDEFEAGLELSDFLDFSSNDEAGNGGRKESVGGLSDACAEDGDEEDDCMANADASDAMLSIWDKVSVTAFRKRQMQHNQKLAALHATGGAHNFGYTKGKEGRLAETITPVKKRKVRQKFLSNRGGANLPQKKKFAHR